MTRRRKDSFGYGMQKLFCAPDNDLIAERRV